MIQKTMVPLSIIAVAIAISGFILGTTVSAQSQITFPVAELGNCTNKESCKLYCDKSENMSACITFAKKNGLMDDSEIKAAENILKNGGPGGCKSRRECESFCESVENIDQCVSFAEKHNLMPQGELEEARKIQAALKRGVKMPPCKNKKDCDAYCGAPENMEICMNFAVEAGFMSPVEKEDAEKMLQALKKGVKPPPCRGKKECEEFCSQDSNLEQCVSFAEAAGFMSPEQAARSRKTGGKGPGGCKGAECETFCNDPKNEEICYQYSVDNDLLPEADRERMREGGRKGTEMLQQAPPEVVSCIKSKIGDAEYEKMMSGKPSRQQGDPFRVCFDEYMSKNKDMKREDQREGQGDDRRQGMPPRMEGDMERYRPEGVPPPEAYRTPPDGMMRPPEDSPYRSGSSEMMPPREDSQFSPPPTSEMQPPSSEPAPPPPAPERESALQARLSEYLTATVFNANSVIIRHIKTRE